MRRLLVLLALSTALAGCCIPSMRPTVESMDDLGDGQAAVVGKLVMDPPFTENEKDMHTNGGAFVIGADRITKNLWVIVGPEKRDPKDQPEPSEMGGSLETPWNKLFFSRFNAGKNVLQTVIVAMTLDQNAYFPLNLKLDVRQEDEVVYIGTIILKRDDYSNPTGMSVRDDSESATPAIRKKFGSKVKIRKALAKAF
jgi:hypothetical protein